MCPGGFPRAYPWRKKKIGERVQKAEREKVKKHINSNPEFIVTEPVTHEICLRGLISTWASVPKTKERASRDRERKEERVGESVVNGVKCDNDSIEIN